MSSKEKALSILSYFGPFFLLAVLLAPESHFAKYHANQGLVLFLTEVVVSTVIMVGRYIPLIGWTFQLLNIVIVVLFFLGLSHAIREVEEPLPFIGEIQILKEPCGKKLLLFAVKKSLFLYKKALFSSIFHSKNIAF